MSRVSGSIKRRLLGAEAMQVLQKLSVVRPIPPDRAALIDRHVALFDGDLPKRRVPPYAYLAAETPPPQTSVAQGRGPNVVTFPDYLAERPTAVEAHDVLFTPKGVAWHDGAACEEFSTGRLARVEHILPLARRAEAERIKEATLIQCRHAQTWGDFLCEQIKTLALCQHRGISFPCPVVLPAAFGERGYVRPQLDRLGIDYRFADQPILIERATVLLKQSYSLIWTSEDVEAVQNAYGVNPPEPERNSIVYLSRQGVKSELKVARSYASDQTARIVKDLGGTVIETATADFDGYTKLANKADIVIADHGAAVLNIMQWRPRVVIDVFAENWWDPIFIQLAAVLGVEDYVTLRGSGLTEDQLRERLIHYVDRARR